MLVIFDKLLMKTFFKEKERKKKFKKLPYLLNRAGGEEINAQSDMEDADNEN